MCLDEGAGDIKSQDFQGKLDELGVALSYDAGYDNFSGNFRTIVENEDEVTIGQDLVELET